MARPIVAAISRLQFRGANKEFLHTLDCREVINSGPSDTGKTFAACYKTAVLCLTFPRERFALVRKTYASITGSAGKTMDRVLAGLPVKKYGGELRIEKWVFPNGSEIVPVGMDKPDKLLSSEWGGVQVCQAEELKEADWEVISSRVTGRGTKVLHPQIYGDCNPGGSKHWLRERAKRVVHGAPVLKLIVCGHKDNPELYDEAGNRTAEGKRRIEALETTLTGVRRKRLLEGKWATAEGAVFDTFDASVHATTIRPAAWATKWMICADEGYTNPAAILLVGADSDGRWHVYREFYCRGVLQGIVIKISKAWQRNPVAAANWLFYKAEPDRARAAASYVQRYVAEAEALDAAQVLPAPPCYPVAVDNAAAGLIADMQDAGLPAVGGKGRILDGIQRLQNRLAVLGDGQPRLTIDPRCEDTINEFESHVWAPDKPKDTPVDCDNHCFTGDTLVLCKHGWHRIDQIGAGDYVWSPFGWNKVREAACTGVKEVRDYGVFKATPDHKILTARGLIPIAALRYLDYVWVWQEARKWSLTECLTGVTRSPSGTVTAFISNALLPKSLQAARARCIKMYGNTTMARCHLARKSITLTATLTIMRWAIWSLLLISNMLQSIIGGRVKSTWSAFAHWRRHGPRAQQDGLRLNVKPKPCGHSNLSQPSSVRYAASRSKLPFLRAAGSVGVIAGSATCEPNATQHCQHTNPTGTATRALTYNLNTDYGCYFAGGILVSNSIAALRYLGDVLAEPTEAFSSPKQLLGAPKDEPPQPGELQATDYLDVEQLTSLTGLNEP